MPRSTINNSSLIHSFLNNMCGRYQLTISDSSKANEFIKQINTQQLKDYKLGEIFPNDNCLTIVKKDKGIELKVLHWGVMNNGLIINARNETINQKPTFKNMKRCVVIANGFYEWKDKTKYFIKTNDEFIYLASLYDENNDMVIITKQSDETFDFIHERSPIILNQKEMLEYLHLSNTNISKKSLDIKEVSEQTKLFN